MLDQCSLSIPPYEGKTHDFGGFFFLQMQELKYS